MMSLPACMRAARFVTLLLVVSASIVAINMRTEAAPAPAPTAVQKQPASYCTGEQFADVCPGDWFYSFVTDLANAGVINGYSDGTFRPTNQITRAQIMKVLVLAMNLQADLPAHASFVDAGPSHPFYAFIEIGAANGLTGGYTCGGRGEPCPGQYFRPSANVNRGQLAKMLVMSMRWTPLTPPTPTFRDVPASSPYFAFVERAVEQGVLGGYPCGAPNEPCPGQYFRPMNESTRAQASKMVGLTRARIPTPTGTRTPPTATRTRTRTPLPTSTPTPGGPCPAFPADNIWHRNISTLPVHALSDSYVASIGLASASHADFGSGLWAGGPIGIPYITVPGSQPRVPVTFYYAPESDPGPYPIPANAPIEGGPDATGDRHVIVIEQGTCTLYEMYSSYPQPDGSWTAGSGARWLLTSNALRPAGWTSADAAGLPMYPGLVTYDEVASGVIRHAIRFTAPRTQQAYIWPARHFASSLTDPALPPMGLRVRLKASVNISTYPQPVRVILQAMKDYGMILADNGSAWYISGVPDERWDNDMLQLLGNIHGTDFEAIDESSLMIDPNSGQSR